MKPRSSVTVWKTAYPRCLKSRDLGGSVECRVRVPNIPWTKLVQGKFASGHCSGMS